MKDEGGTVRVSLVSGKNCSSPTGNISEYLTSFSTVLYPLRGTRLAAKRVRRRRFSIVEKKQPPNLGYLVEPALPRGRVAQIKAFKHIYFF